MKGMEDGTSRARSKDSSAGPAAPPVDVTQSCKCSTAQSTGPKPSLAEHKNPKHSQNRWLLSRAFSWSCQRHRADLCWHHATKMFTPPFFLCFHFTMRRGVMHM